MPPWLEQACNEKGVEFLDIRLSPLQFGRDLYIALRCSSLGLYRRIARHAVLPEEIRLEASILAANMRLHQQRMVNERGYRFESLDNSLVFVGQPPYDLSLLSAEGQFLRCNDFVERLRELCEGKNLYYKAHPSAGDYAEDERSELEKIVGKRFIPCQQNAYQILSTYDDAELVGISASLLQEAPWFDKCSHILFQPAVPLVNSGEEALEAYQQVHFQTFLSPSFWHQIFTPERTAPRLASLPVLLHHHARQTLDLWQEYSKVITWERPLQQESFARSGGAALRQRVNDLENAAAVHLPFRSEGIRRLKNSKLGQTAYVLGAGPSLNELDVRALLAAESFWCNRAYELEQLYPGLRFEPKYYVVSDPYVYEKHSGSIMDVRAGTKFFRGDVYRLATQKFPDELSNQAVVPFQMKNSPCMDEGYFSEDPALFVYRGFTVVLDAIQLAFYMGYERVYVGGVDLDYTQPYFFGETVKGNMPIRRAQKSFEIARQRFERQGRTLAKITRSPNLPLQYVSSSVLVV